MKVAALQRSEFLKAKNYMAKWDAVSQEAGHWREGDGARRRHRDWNRSSRCCSDKRTVHFHTHRADDILTVLRLKDEFGFELVIQHGTESYKVSKAIAKHNVPSR